MKKILYTLTIIMLMTTQAFADQSGTCGDNATWTLNETTGVLTISGTGETTNYGNYSDSPFYNLSSIKQVIIREGITSIGNYAFYSCSGLTSINIPNSVTSIGNYAFRDCSGLTSINIPNSVTNIADGTFYGCSGLTSINIPYSVTRIGNNAFYGCNSISHITIHGELIVHIPADIRNNFVSVSITEGSRQIVSNSFKKCAKLERITIPNSVTSIGEYVFSDCSGLKSINIPNSVTNIGNYAFLDCI